MTDQDGRRARRAMLATGAAALLGLGAIVAAAIAALGSADGMWGFGAGLNVVRYAFFAAAAAIPIAVIALWLARRAGLPGLNQLNIAALIVAATFLFWIGSMVRTAKALPPIHDISTDLKDVPQFTALKVRPDNLADTPDMGRPGFKAMTPEARWKALHREAYHLRPAFVRSNVPGTITWAKMLAEERGWQIARFDPEAGILEATATSRFFRFKDDIVIRARPTPDKLTRVDMRSLSRVGASDIGVNAERIRAFDRDLARVANNGRKP